MATRVERAHQWANIDLVLERPERADGLPRCQWNRAKEMPLQIARSNLRNVWIDLRSPLARLVAESGLVGLQGHKTGYALAPGRRGR